MAEGSGGQELVEAPITLLSEITSFGDYLKSHRRECTILARRLKLLAPLFEEVRELKGSLPDQVPASLHKLKAVLQSARDLLYQCYHGSKIYLVLRSHEIAAEFQAVTSDLEHALDGLPLGSLDLSEEVREQVELLHAQLKRAKARAEPAEKEAYVDLMSLVCFKEERESDRAAAERLSQQLHLRSLSELKEESRALQNMIMDNGGDIDETIDHVCLALRKLKAFVFAEQDQQQQQQQQQQQETSSSTSTSTSTSTRLTTATARRSSPTREAGKVIPGDFRCPISLELMKDPVIVATGQTYERAYIQRWLDAGHKTCPITQQTLPHLVLTPNYVLRSLISQWCETNGFELGSSSEHSAASPASTTTATPDPAAAAAGDKAVVKALLEKVSSEDVEVQRAAVGELRLLAKRSIENRVCIAEAGGIPLLIGLLSASDARVQEHAVTALLNLSIHDSNKGHIVQAGAINPIVEVLKSGSMEARENAAATLFSLSVVDDNKVTIGSTGAIPALVELLKEGTARGKKDAATALFNLSIYQGNKARAVRAGVVPPLMQLLEPGAGMVDEALAILAILATHHEGRAAIGHECTIPLLVQLVRCGSARNKENAAAVLFALGQNDAQHLVAAQQLGAARPLAELLHSGTSRARRKAGAILDLMRRHCPGDLDADSAAAATPVQK